MTFPVRLDDDDGYRRWRATKLDGYPSRLDALRVPIAELQAPTCAEIAAIRACIAKCNMALVDCGDPTQVTPRALLRLGERLGLRRTDTHRCSDANAVSRIRIEPQGRASELIPYTNRPLNWHTDGYYASPARPVCAWMLFCIQDAVSGGENALLDPEIAYLRLRDRDPALIRALMHPRALEIPPNTEAGVALRGASIGPVFCWPDGQLHMRYTARKRHALWLPTPETSAAREALSRLFSGSESFIFRHKLMPGEGYITNNVLHNRSGFESSAAPSPGRTLLRVRYLDRINNLEATPWS